MRCKGYFFYLIIIVILLGASIQADSTAQLNGTDNSSSNDLNESDVSPGPCIFNSMFLSENMTILGSPTTPMNSLALYTIRGVNNLNEDIVLVFTSVNQTTPIITLEIAGNSSEMKQYPPNTFEIFIRKGDTWYKSPQIVTTEGGFEYEYSVSEGTDGKGPILVVDTEAPIIAPKSEEKGYSDDGNASLIDPSIIDNTEPQQNQAKFTTLLDDGNVQILRENYQGALEYYNQALALNNSSETAWACKGGALNFLENYEESLDAYNNAISISPHDDELWLGKGAALNNLGQTDEAYEALNRTLEFEPDNDQVEYLAQYLGKPQLYFFHTAMHYQ